MTKRTELSVVPYRSLYPFTPQIDGSCRMCNQWELRRVHRNEQPTTEKWGPELNFEPAIAGRWWRKGTPARMRRNCRLCGAVYYTVPGGYK